MFDQSRFVDEIIVVDDASDDTTWLELQEMAGRYNNLILHRFSVSKGACAARNKAIQLASGDFITGLDDDDFFRLHRIADFLSTDIEGCSMLASSYAESNGDKEYDNFARPELIDLGLMRQRNYIGNQVFVRREVVLAVGGYDESLKSCQDYDLWIRIISQFGPVKIINNCSYVQNVSNSHKRITNTESAEIGFNQFICKHKSFFTKSELELQKANDLYNRKVDIKLAEIFMFGYNWSAIKRLASLFVMKKIPWLVGLMVKSKNVK